MENIVGGLEFITRLPMNSLVLPVTGYKKGSRQAEVFFRDLKASKHLFPVKCLSTCRTSMRAGIQSMVRPEEGPGRMLAS